MTKDAQRAEVIAKVWKNPELKQKLLDNPQKILQEMQVGVPSDANVKVREVEGDELYFMLPAAPADVENLTDAELQEQAAGGCQTATCCYETVK